MNLLAQIDQLLDQIASVRPLNQGELLALKQTLDTEFVYNSNSIEGNTLTLGETKLILEEGITIAGKPLREVYEASNHTKVLESMYQVIEQQEAITEDLIKDIHQLVLRNIDDENAGSYRRIDVRISGEEANLPDAKTVPDLMTQFVVAVKSNSLEHIVIRIADFHYDFVKIHPFVDGNGRTIRVLMNILLLQNGYPLVIIPTVRRAEYIRVLHSSRTKEDFRKFFADVVLQNLKDYLRMIGS